MEKEGSNKIVICETKRGGVECSFVTAQLGVEKRVEFARGVKWQD